MAVRVVASVRAIDALVFVVLGEERLECAVIGCGFDGNSVFAEGGAVDVVRERLSYHVVGLGPQILFSFY